jgi:branched-chain amino acid transport system permease protein
LALGIIAAPHFLPPYYQSMIIQILVFALLAASLDILLGQLGLVSLGHAAFFGTAGYVAAWLGLGGITNLWLNLGISLAVTGLVSALYALIVMNAKGGYFLMITLALAQVFWAVGYSFISVTGGEYGLADLPRPVIGGGLQLEGLTLQDVTGVLIFAALLTIRSIIRSPFGLVLRGFKDSDARMAALGYSAFVYKLLAFCISGVFAGLAGILWVYHNRYVSPANLSIEISAIALLMATLGGSGTILGPLLGSVILVTVETIATGYTEYWQIVVGAVYIVVSLALPGGITRSPIFQRRFGSMIKVARQ